MFIKVFSCLNNKCIGLYLIFKSSAGTWLTLMTINAIKFLFGYTFKYSAGFERLANNFDSVIIIFNFVKFRENR